jgi:deoxyribonuclease V
MKWPETFTINQARELQTRLRGIIRIVRFTQEPRYVAGVDAAFSDDRAFAAACLYLFPEMILVEEHTSVRQLSFPYVPGYLAFREGSAILAALEKLQLKPDLILVDGQGIAHPRGMGIASYLGVLTGIPTIGCAKSRLVGEHDEPGLKKGDWSPLRFRDKTVGAVLRTRDNTRPLFISPGHKIDLPSSIGLALACTSAYRIPEPLRCADMLSKRTKKAEADGDKPG